MKLNKKSISIIIVLLIAVIGGGVCIVSQSRNNTDLNTDQHGQLNKEQSENVKQQEKKQPVKENSQKQSEEKVEELKVEDIDTSNWKTYRNEELGFEFQYPQDWFCGGIALDPNSTKNIFCIPSEFKDDYYAGRYNNVGIMVYVDKKKQFYNNVDKYGVISATLEGKEYNIQFTVFPVNNDKKNWIQGIFFNLKHSFKFTK